MNTFNFYGFKESLKIIYDFARNMEAYNQLVEISSNKEIVSQETENQIQKDLMRTFQKIELFASDNMKMKLEATI